MAWNRSGTENQQKKPNAKPPSAKRGVIAGAVVVALGALCLWMFSGEDAAPEAKPDKGRGRIKEVDPAVVAGKTVRTNAAPVVEIRTLPDGTYMKYVNGKPDWMFPRHKHTPVIITNDTARTRLTFEQKVFKNAADAQIAVLLRPADGGLMLGDSASYYKGFAKRLEKAMKAPVDDDPSDTEFVKALKKDVREIRADLYARMQNGEDVEKIMIEARDEQQKLGLYKRDLEKEVRRLAKDGDFDEKEAEELIGAANKMLEERGAAPMKMPGFLKAKARLSLKIQEGKNKNE